MARGHADLDFVKKLEIKNYQALPMCCRRKLNISRGCLRSILCNGTALRSEVLLLLLEGRDQKRQRHGKDQEVEEGFSNF